MDQLDDDSPPFALSELSRPLHLFGEVPTTTRASASTTPSEYIGKSKLFDVPSKGKSFMAASQNSSSPPGMVESVVTDGSSSVEFSGVQEQQCSFHAGASSNFLLSSLPTISSVIGRSSFLPNSHHAFGQQEGLLESQDQSQSISPSGTFSQLMRAAGGEDLHQSKMPSVPEDASMEGSSTALGALISSPSLRPESLRNAEPTNQWLPSFLSNSPRTGLSEPLLDTSLPADAHLLGTAFSEDALQRARTSVNSFLEDDQTFEVSMDVFGRCSMQSVMNVIGNPKLLRLWCDPVQSLVVTSTSDGCQEPAGNCGDGREYEGEWIEATTTALESPASRVGQIYGAGQIVLDALGCSSYGRITMFVERRRGHVGLTIGPFSGGIHASHHISVTESGGKVRIVDRVRLTRDMEGASTPSLLLCGVLDSCLLSSCLMPSLKAYMEQVSTSMARLNILVTSIDAVPTAEMVGAR